MAQERGNKLNINIQVEKAFKVSVKNYYFSKIIIYLKDKTMKSKLITSCKKNRSFFPNQINKNWSNFIRKYINNHLTKTRNYLLYKTNESAKEKSYKYVWANEADILERKDDQSRILRIRELDYISAKML